MRFHCFLGFFWLCAVLSKQPKVIEDVLDSVCNEGDLFSALFWVRNEKFANLLASESSRGAALQAADKAAYLHIRSALEMIVYGNYKDAVKYHLEAKSIDKSVVPPLANMHLEGKTCGGIGDILFVSAVIIKEIANNDSIASFLNEASQILSKSTIAILEPVFESLTTLITLTSDSGLYREAEQLCLTAIQMVHTIDDSNDGALVLLDEQKFLAFSIRAALLTPALYESKEHLLQTRQGLVQRIMSLRNSRDIQLTSLDEFVISPTFYYVYQGYEDKELLSQLHAVYANAFPAIGTIDITHDRALLPVVDNEKEHHLRIGFVSAHLRKHSMCKLFCGVISGLAKSSEMEVFVFSSLQENREDAYTRNLISTLGTTASDRRYHFIRVGKTVVHNRFEVINKNIDVLVYLDVGMDPSTMIWASSRLAPVQMCLWGHPTTTGMDQMDYFVSSQAFISDMELSVTEQSTTQRRQEQQPLNSTAIMLDNDAASAFPYKRYSEQLVLLDSLGFYFALPRLDDQEPIASDGLRELITFKAVRGFKLVLCPQFLPKLHPQMDIVFRKILTKVPNARLVLLFDSEKKFQWRRSLEKRWNRTIGAALMKNILWLNHLNSGDYLRLLQLGDIMIDPFPFGGGVTTLESLAMCTPVITLPSHQNVPGLAAGMLHRLNTEESNEESEKWLIARSLEGYIDNIVSLLGDSADYPSPVLQRLKEFVCRNKHLLYNASDAVEAWHNFLTRV